MFQAYIFGNEVSAPTCADGRPLSRSLTPPRLRRQKTSTLRNAYTFESASALDVRRPWTSTPRSGSVDGRQTLVNNDERCRPWPRTPRSASAAERQSGARMARKDEMRTPPLVHHWNSMALLTEPASQIKDVLQSPPKKVGECHESGNESSLSTSTGTQESGSDCGNSDSPRSSSIASFESRVHPMPEPQQRTLCEGSYLPRLPSSNITSERPESSEATHRSHASPACTHCSPTGSALTYRSNASVVAAREASASARHLGKQVGTELLDLADEMRILTLELKALKGFVETA